MSELAFCPVKQLNTDLRNVASSLAVNRLGRYTHQINDDQENNNRIIDITEHMDEGKQEVKTFSCQCL